MTSRQQLADRIGTLRRANATNLAILDALAPDLVEEYVYDVAEVRKVTDGDTYEFVIWQDIGFGDEVRRRKAIRLDYRDTPEATKGSPYERAEGKRAHLIADQWLTTVGRTLKVRTRKPAPDRPPVGDGGFGRWLGDVWDAETGEHLGDYLRSLNLASVWPTRWRDEFDHTLS